MVQVLFLVSLLGGVAILVGAIGMARLRWRNDVAPFGRHTNAFKVLARPESYVVAQALPLIRTLTFFGYGLAGVGVVCLIYQFLADLGRL
jgi:hypothetical protein